MTHSKQSQIQTKSQFGYSQKKKEPKKSYDLFCFSIFAQVICFR